MNLETLTLQEQIDGLREKKFSSVELVENYISVIEDNEDLNIFVSNDFERALKKAKNAHCLQENLLKYRIKENSLSKSKLSNVGSVSSGTCGS